MNKRGALIGILAITIFVLASCGSTSPLKADKAGEVNNQKDTVVKSDKDILSSMNLNDPLVIDFKKAQLRHITNASENTQMNFKTDEKDFYYVYLKYNVSNSSPTMYAWSDFETAIVDGKQEKLNDPEINFGKNNGYEIQGNSEIDGNSIKLLAKKSTSKVELIPTEPLENNEFTGEEEEYVPENIIINFK
ncbi:TPA: hypothetical protein ACTOGR_001970 [Listeria monocytogenes]|nr:hypothetical protein [Listeria monocytogenes]EAH1539897.1 hypothetical protein [Listeria monocytogenes]EAH1852153.1 hypothetical protein [Listeria monocytogenes]EAH1908099.1 hypothetical protein [Listeria monocytogenes]EAH3261419.1 hypothetical protein [Listeria monocytogenes]